MTAMTDSAVSWRIEGSRAHLRCGVLDAYVEFTNSLQLVVEKWKGRPTTGIAVLSSTGPSNQSPLEIADQYVRGADLVVSYKPTGAHRITPHVYWRAKLNE